MVDPDPTGAPVWLRPHPATLVLELVQALRATLGLLLLVVWGRGSLGLDSVVELAFVAGPLVLAVARWLTTRYSVDDDAIRQNRGVLWRHRQVLPRANIQQVSTRSSLVARVLNVTALDISDASSGGSITLRFLSMAEADRLTVLLRSNLPPSHSPSPSSSPSSSTPPSRPAPAGDEVGTGAAPAHGPDAPAGTPVIVAPLVQPPFGRLVRVAGLNARTAGAVVTMMALAAGFGAASIAAPDLLDRMGQGRWVALALMVGVPLLIAVVAAIEQLLTIGGFELSADPDRIRIRSGLVTEHNVAVRRERLQQIRVTRDPVHRFMGYETVGFETADVDLTTDESAVDRLDPAADLGTWTELVERTVGPLQLGEADLRPVSPLTRRRARIRVWLGGAPLVLVAGVLAWPLAVPVAAVVAAGGWWYGGARYQALGWVRSTDQMLVRSGVVTRRLVLVRLDKVQNVQLASSWFQRRLGLVSLRLVTAGRGRRGIIGVPDLDAGDADRLVIELARRSAATPDLATL
ncbi:MAG: PH domain-containing protein [Acidimicrobiales bacterium]